METTGLWQVAAAVLGYGLGSIPFGLILTRLAGTSDIRTIGSGNIGATNVLRTGRKDLAAATLLLDALKGTAAALLAQRLGGETAALVAGCAAFMGHLFPVWLDFRGGKGVATFLGCLLGIFWPAGILFCLVWLAVAFALRLSSAAALVATAVAPVALFGFGRPAAAAVFLGMAVIAWWKHRGNLSRLLAGTETKIGQKT